jgi:hypothetical protein
LEDLSEYLNSTDYMVAFLGDSLRHAWSLLDELEEITTLESVKQLEETIVSLAAEHRRHEQRAAALGRLGETPWANYFAKLGEDLSSIAAGRIEKLRESTSDKIADAVDAWFEGDGSFQSLIEDELQPVLQATRDDLVRTVSDVLQTVAGTDTAGSNPTNEVKSDLATVGVRMGRVGRACLKIIDPVKGLASAKLTVSTQIVPVKRGFFDYLFLRRMPALQKRLFGADASPSQPVSRQLKARKLGDDAREALQHGFEVAFDDYLSGALDHISTHVLSHYVETLRRGLKGELRKLSDASALEQAAVERRLTELKEVSVALDALREIIGTTGEGLAVLSKQYGETDPELLEQLVSGEVEGLLPEITPADLLGAIDLSAADLDDDSTEIDLDHDQGTDLAEGDDSEVSESDEQGTTATAG